MSASLQEVKIPAPELRGANLAIGACQDPEVCIEGKAGTGKTVGICFKIHMILSSYPGMRGLMSRKYYTDLVGSAVSTYRGLLHPSERVQLFGGSRFEPPGFRYPNGSALWLAGLDKPEKVQSKEFDIAFINEALECTENDIEFVGMRLRPRMGGPEVPYRQLILDVNPGPPTHWLNQRMINGKTRRMISHHEDNPAFYDLRTGDWTEAGREYIFGKLASLTGVRKSRYFFGIWAAAEGTVYEDSWDRDRNVIKPFPIPREWPRYLSVDFGYTNPFVCAWWTMDPDGRLYCYREIYKTKRIVEDHCVEIALRSGWYHKLPKEHIKRTNRPTEWADPLPRDVIADHDSEDRQTFERHLGLYTTPAKKSVSDGIQAMQARLRPAGDGRPRLFYFANALVERDEELARAKKPVCTVEEFDTYVWKRGADGSAKEEPVKESDHGMDQSRYMVAYHDLIAKTVSYYKNPW